MHRARRQDDIGSSERRAGRRPGIRLQAALALVKAHGGHITCVQTVSDVPVAPDPTAAATEAEALVELEQVAREFQKTIEAALEGSGADWSWLRFYGDPATALIERSRFADVIVMSTKDAFPPISSVALHTRTPVLAVPRRDPNSLPSARPWSRGTDQRQQPTPFMGPCRCSIPCSRYTFVGRRGQR